MDAKKPRKPGRIGGDMSEIVAELPAACSDETLAVEFMERQRWGDTPCCPRCGDIKVRKMLGANGERNKRFLWKCSGCKRQFTVRINSVYEDSRIPMRHWVFAFWSSCTHKKGVSALQIKRQTGLNYRSALFMMNRIRHAMGRREQADQRLQGTVEADEVYIGGAPRRMSRPKWSKKVPVLAVVERGGEVRAWPVTRATSANLHRFIRKNVSNGTVVVTDGHAAYRGAVDKSCTHQVIRHDLQVYVDRDDPSIHTNTVEGFFNLLRKRIDGTHHAVSPEHLYRYTTEACFLYTNRHVDDGERTVRAIKSASGKRLTYADSVLCERR